MNNISSFNQLKPQHFCPTTHWQEVHKGTRVYFLDEDTGVKYQKVGSSLSQRVGFAVYALTWTPFAFTGVALIATIMRITRVVTFKSLWEALPPDETGAKPFLTDRIKILSKDTLMIPVGLLAVIFAELAMIYSVLSPQNGMRNVDSWSRVITADMLPPPIDVRYNKPKNPFKRL